MKRIIVFCVGVLLLVGVAWGQEIRTDANSKIYDISRFSKGDYANKIKQLFVRTDNNLVSKNVYYLEGFDFEKYNPSTSPKLKDMTNAEVSAVWNGLSNQVTRASGTYSLIGHSQGGLRALGFITQTEKTHPGSENKIDAVITISGIDRGLKMLDDGLGGFKRRASANMINVLGNGLLTATGIFDRYNIFAMLLPRNCLTAAIDIVLELTPSSWRPYWLEAWRTTDPGKDSQLDSMIPNSTYINDNVVVITGTKTYKVKTGEKTVNTTITDRTTDGSWIIMPHTYTTEEYRYYTRTGTVTQFDANVPLGFIVGTDSNTLGMAEEKEKTIRNALRGAEIAFGVIEGVHIAKCARIWGLFFGSAALAQDADKARRLMRYFDSALNDIKGSSENDGLVAVESQYIPRANMDNPVLWGGEKGYYEVHQNHNKIEKLTDAYEIAQKMIIDGAKIREEKRKELVEANK